jgi:tetratricopeptide (TPR) repeat protein
MAGFGGGRERGIRLVEEAAATPSDVQTNAKFALVVIYNRERRYAEALRIVQQLQQRFPRNRLLWLEAASTALRAGRPVEANAAIEQGLTMFAGDSRPRAFGEAARWRYQHGLSLAAMNLNAAAETEFRAALNTECQPWLRGRTLLELGKLIQLSNGGTSVPAEARQAVDLCSAAKDEACVKEARALMRRSR